MQSVIERHPQRATIIEGLLAGRSLRDIAASVSPPVSHHALHRYSKRHVQPTQDGANVLSNALKTLAEASGNESVAIDPVVATRAALLADPYLARIAKHRDTIDRSVAIAEADGDTRSVAALVSTDLKGLELDARLTGRLDSAASSTTIQIVTPAVTIHAAPQQPAEDVVTIDIGPGR